MANIESLHGSDKLREAYPKVNRNFNAVDREVTDLRTRVNNIITTPIDGEAAAQEVVDARNSAAKSKIFDTLDARLEEAEQDNATVNDALAAHKADKVTDDDGIHGLKMKKGTWTPEIDAETTSPTVNYTAQQGYYVRNGDIVHVSFYISCTISGGSGITFITGLPISPDNYREVGNIGFVQHNNIAVNYYSLQNGAKLNQFRILKDSRFPLQISEINDSNNFTMTGSITYRI
jgi:hypothetical protein